MKPYRPLTATNQQLALFCARCGELLMNVTEQAAQLCNMCQVVPNTATVTTPSPQAHTKAVRRSSSALAPTQPSAPPRPRSRRRPSWIYEASNDELLALLAIFNTLFNHKPPEDTFLDDRHALRDLRHLYAAVVDAYFDADAPYGINRAGILRWHEERLRQNAHFIR